MLWRKYYGPGMVAIIMVEIVQLVAGKELYTGVLHRQ
jgi:hypothetical protein